LQFRLGSIPVRVHFPFLFLTIVLGVGVAGRGVTDGLPAPLVMAVWVPIVFVSVMVHELGHALVGRAFGLVPRIDLHGMGATTSWAESRDVGNGRSIAISLAGPFAGFALAGALWSLGHLGFHPKHLLLEFAMKQTFFVNLVWSIFNLAPMLPLDGGNVVRSALNGLTNGRGERGARLVSIVTGVLFLVWAALTVQLWLGAMAAFLLWMNLQGYHAADTRTADEPLARAIDKAYVALERHDGAEALALLRPVIVPQASEDLRAIGLRVYSYALLLEGMWDELLPTLEKNALLIGAEEISRYARTARELGRKDEADRIDALVPRPRPANDFS
jgi:Zn-dependent protease